MKTVVIVYDGVADTPQDDLNGRTPLQVARCPCAAALARKGRVGLLVCDDSSQAVTKQSILARLLGVPDAVAGSLARGPIEAASLQDPETTDVCYRGEFVTLDGEYMRESTMHHLTHRETASLSCCLQQDWSQPNVRFVPVGPGFMSVQPADLSADEFEPGTSPLVVEGAHVKRYLPSRRKTGFLHDFFDESASILSHQTVNDVRLDLGENPASAVWLWGGGRLSETVSLLSDFPVSGAMLSQSAMAHGLGSLCSMAAIDIQTPWQWTSRKTAFRVADVVSALRQFDFLAVYLEAPQKLGRFGPAVDKVRALETVDKYLLAPLLSILDTHGPYRIMLVADGMNVSDHDNFSEQLPCLIAGDDVSQDEADKWEEQQCRRDGADIQCISEALAQLREGI